MASVNDASLARLGQAYRERERKIKVEIAVVALLWLIGCPLLCLIDDDSLYGTPDNEHLCGLISYSISCSMTGLHPKVLGSIMAPLFAILVVQRSSNGLCSNLKLGWLVRFSPLVSKDLAARHDEKLALKLWKRIQKIELLAYLAAGCLVVLVACDAQHFPMSHMFFATAAFYLLSMQNRLVGTLEKDFPNVFPNWSHPHATRVYYWGMVHLSLVYLSFFVLGTLKDRNRCNDLLAALESTSLSVFGNPTTMRWLASVALWYNEYAFALLCIYVQLLEHYEYRLWEFAGATNMPLMGIVSRFSILAALLGDSDDAEVFLGTKLKAG